MKRFLSPLKKIILILTLTLYSSGSNSLAQQLFSFQKKLPNAFSEIKIDYESFELVYILNFA